MGSYEDSISLLETELAAADGIAATAAILDDLLARRTIPGRPAEFSDDLGWILAASGRAGSSDTRLPLIG